MKLYIIAWKSYNEWRSSMPFATEAEANKWADSHHRQPDRDYYTNVQIIEIEVEE